MAIIIGSVDIILLRPGDVSAEIADDLCRIRRSARSALTTIDALVAPDAD